MDRTIESICTALKQEFPQYERTMDRGSQGTQTYIPWYHVRSILDEHAPGWNLQAIRENVLHGREPHEDKLQVVVRLTIVDTNGAEVSRDGVGLAYFKEYSFQKKEYVEVSYGDVSSNAFSMAFKRAAALFGIGAYLYDKDRREQQAQPPTRQAGANQQARAATAAAAPAQQGKKFDNEFKGFPANPVWQTEADKLSVRQRSAIFAIGDANGIDAELVCRDEMNCGVDDLTRAAASALIAYLKQ